MATLFVSSLYSTPFVSCVIVGRFKKCVIQVPGFSSKTAPLFCVIYSFHFPFFCARQLRASLRNARAFASFHFGSFVHVFLFFSFFFFFSSYCSHDTHGVNRTHTHICIHMYMSCLSFQAKFTRKNHHQQSAAPLNHNHHQPPRHLFDYFRR